MKEKRDKVKYERLCNRSTECCNLYDKTKDVKYLMEDDCIMHFFGAGGMENYEKILEFAKYHGFNRVFDIGAAIGHQSEVFLNSGIDYVGIEECRCDSFWNSDRYNYIVERYPFKIEATEKDLAVSVLCLTWNCYLGKNMDILKEQCEALKRDFKSCLLYAANDNIDFVKKYFSNFEYVNKERIGSLVYFGN